MKLEIPLPTIAWKKVLTLRAALITCVLASFVYWWFTVHPFIRVDNAVLRAATLELYASSAGCFAAKKWEEGDAFQKGERLALFQEDSLDAQLQASQELLNQERANLEEAMHLYVAAQTESKPADVMDQIVFRIQQAQQRIADAELEVSRSQEKIAQQVAVVAPFEGIILKAFKQNGQKTAVGEPIFSLCERGKLWVEATLPERWLGSLQIGTAASVTFPSFPQREWSAAIDRISPVVEGAQVKIRLRADELPLSPGLTAHVRIRVN